MIPPLSEGQERLLDEISADAEKNKSVGRIEGGGPTQSSGSYPASVRAVTTQQPSDLDASHPSDLDRLRAYAETLPDEEQDRLARRIMHAIRLLDRHRKGTPEYVPSDDFQPARLSGL